MGGAPPEWIEALQSEEVEMLIEPENWPIVKMFMRLQTQWREGFSGRTGLDYSAIEVVGRMLKVEVTEELFDGLQVMEFAALEELRRGS